MTPMHGTEGPWEATAAGSEPTGAPVATPAAPPERLGRARAPAAPPERLGRAHGASPGVLGRACRERASHWADTLVSAEGRADKQHR